jgi:hypothetical protein
LELRYAQAADADGGRDARASHSIRPLETGHRNDVNTGKEGMSVYHGILNLTNWAGNVIMPTLGALFIAIAILQFARGQHQVYSMWAYGGILCLLVSGLLRAMEKFTGQLGWNNPDLYWNSILNLVDWFANVILPVYAGMHVTLGAIQVGEAFTQYTHHQVTAMRHFVAALLCLMGSGLVRLAEFFVSRGTGGVS